MDSSLSDEQKLKWIFGNMFFTTCIVIVSFIQVYIYYHNDFEARNLCLGTFFVIAVALLVATKNIPLSLLTAIIFSNLITNCSDVKLLNKLKPKKEEKAVDEKKKEIKEIEKKINNENGVMKEKPEEDKIIKEEKQLVEKVLNEPENKKMKQKYLKGAKFTPYLTDNNKDAYPKQPNSIKFQ